MRKLLWMVVAAVSIGAMALGVFGLNHRAAEKGAAAKAPEAKAAVPVMVTTEPAAARPIQRRVPVVGSLWGEDEIAITPKVDGRIVKICKQVGDKVKQGDLLFEIEEKNYQLAVDEAKRSLELDLSKVGLREVPHDNFDISGLPMVVKAASEELLAQQNYQRLMKIVGSSAAEKEEAKSKWDVARANTRQTRFDVETSLAQVRLKQAMLATAQQRLADTDVIVPRGKDTGSSKNESQIEYLVAERNISIGDTVTSTIAVKPAYRLVIADPVKLLATVPERHVEEIKLDQKVEVRVESTSDTFPGKVWRINPTVDRVNRTFQVEILIRNPALRLHPGSFAKADILTRIDDKALTVPEEALVTFGGSAKLFVLRGDKVAEVPVETGVRFDVPGEGRTRVWVEVRGKLLEKEAVVTSGQSKLVDGALGQVRESSIRSTKN